MIDANDKFILSTHLDAVESQKDGPLVVHRWTGAAVKATRDLLLFLDLFKKPVSVEELVATVSVHQLKQKLERLLALKFILHSQTDEEIQYLSELSAIKNKKFTCTRHFIIYYPEGIRAVDSLFIDLMETVYYFLVLRGLPRIRRKSIIHICETHQEYAQLWGDAPLSRHIHCFTTKGRILVLKPVMLATMQIGYKGFFSAMAHEMVHIFLCQNYVKLPVWAVEGVCEYFSGRHYRLSFEALSELKEIKRFHQIESTARHSLLDVDASPMTFNIGYRQSLSFIEFLVDCFGEAKLLECIFDTGLLKMFAMSLREKTRYSIETLEKMWRMKLRREKHASYMPVNECPSKNDEIISSLDGH